MVILQHGSAAPHVAPLLLGSASGTQDLAVHQTMGLASVSESNAEVANQSGWARLELIEGKVAGGSEPAKQ